MPEPRPLDPVTLRVLAGELDAEEQALRRACPCPLHRHLASQCVDRATDYRTRAIRAEQAARSGRAN